MSVLDGKSSGSEIYCLCERPTWLRRHRRVSAQRAGPSIRSECQWMERVSTNGEKTVRTADAACLRMVDMAVCELERNVTFVKVTHIGSARRFQVRLLRKFRPI
jgi:hypothetical protein